MKSGQKALVVRGAREHNLRGVDVDIPRGSLTTVTGVSGSGKSSLAYDTIFKEGQRRYIESLSAYARQFLGQGEKPRVDHIEGLSPTVSIDQKTVSRNPRSTVGTITEVHDHLRLLFARLGVPHCPRCGDEVRPQTADEIVEALLSQHASARLQVLATIVRDRKGSYRKELAELRGQGYVRARIDGEMRRLDEQIELARYERHTIQVVLDRLRAEEERRGRLTEAVEKGLDLGKGTLEVLVEDDLLAFSSLRACQRCGISVPELEPRNFSFNSPSGACARCEGLGMDQDLDLDLVIPDHSLSIDEGAIVPSVRGGWQIKRFLRLEILQQVCDALLIPRDRPWKELSEVERDAVLNGRPDQIVPIHLDVRRGRVRMVKDFDIAWRGVIPGLAELHAAGTARRALSRFMAPARCPECQGMRLAPSVLAVRFRGRSIGDLSRLTVDDLLVFLEGLELDERERLIGARLMKELHARLAFLSKVGVGYLEVERKASTLSGGEAQRIRLATQVGSRLRGVLYVLDEPSIGLHQRDNRLLIETLEELRDTGNTVLVVEHDQETIEASDFCVDIGPGAGSEGGELIVAGSPAQMRRTAASVTGAFLSGKEAIEVPVELRVPGDERLWIRGARAHNLKGIDVEVPLGLFIAVTGVSGSGKSTLIDHVLKRALAAHFHQAQDAPGAHDAIEGLEHLDKVIEIDQTPIGRTPRSNPATYTKLFDLVRDLYEKLPESQVRGYKKGRFSFNVKGGRCEECAGAGVKVVEMQFLADVTVPCETCEGRRFNPETLEVHFKGRSINDVLEMTVSEALVFFQNQPKLRRILEVLERVGLGYVALGQPSTTLSGGEAQRVKLAKFLHRPPTGRTLYILDEPTTGLHFADVRRLIAALQDLVEQGNTVLVIEHDLDVIKCADWIIDLGPEGGAHGGELLYSGAADGLVETGGSETARVLQEHLHPERRPARKRRPIRDLSVEGDISIRGASLHNLAGVDVEIPGGSLCVVTGPSGSGKTSLAFDTLFAEGQRRFVECLSTYARQFLGRVDRPPIDEITGLAPAIAIDQKNASRNPRSTVATVTEIHDSLRLLYARVGTPRCPRCGEAMKSYSPDAAATALFAAHEGEKGRLLAPLYREESQRHVLLAKPSDLKKMVAKLREDGFRRVLIDGEEHRLDRELPPTVSASEISLVIDRITLDRSRRARLLEGLETAWDRGLGLAFFAPDDGERVLLSETPACPACDVWLDEELTPRHFSFNSHVGACRRCNGLGAHVRCDPDKLIKDPSQPLFEGAMVERPGDFIARLDGYQRTIITQLAEAHGHDLSGPWKDLDADFRHAVMHGGGGELDVAFRSKRTKTTWELRTSWQGLCHYVENWHRNSAEKEGWGQALARVMSEETCAECAGERLAEIPRCVTVGDLRLAQLSRLSVEDALAWVQALELSGAAATIAAEIRKELLHRLGFLRAVGLGYLSLDRSAGTLSGGEAQRIRLATQIGNKLTGVLYVLDEPTIGLHPRDTERLLVTLEELRDLGNTVVVVEHDRDTIERADWVVDMGPGSGHRGGQVCYMGPRDGFRSQRTLTSDYLHGRRSIRRDREPRKISERLALKLKGATTNNLKGVDLILPRAAFCVVTGVSGSGKSSLIMDTLAPALKDVIRGRKGAPRGAKKLEGAEAFERCVVVDQTPIGSSPRSNPASYTGVLDPIREVMAKAPLAKMRGYAPGRFSFNRGEGRCATCEGRGSIKVEMHFLPDVWVLCEACRGKRFNQQTLEVRWREKSIADILEMEAHEALTFFENHRRIAPALQLLVDVGLGYLKLGQSAVTLSGGEAQRMKLARELAGRGEQRTLYVLDEPTTGLHFDDVSKLLTVLHRLADKGNTVCVIEHNLDVIADADWLCDLGPEGGEAGGRILYQGPVAGMADRADSFTAHHLVPLLKSGAKE